MDTENLDDLRFSAVGLNYPDACDLMDSLRAANIECNISAGAISIYGNADQFPMMKAICDFKGAVLQGGAPAEYEAAVLQSQSPETIERLRIKTIAANNLLCPPKS